MYTYIRLSQRFGLIPGSFKIAIPLTIFVHGFNAYLVSRTFRREFLANYKAKESSKDFKKFLHNLPEGVSIIDDWTYQFKFINMKLKQTFDVNSFAKTSYK